MSVGTEFQSMAGAVHVAGVLFQFICALFQSGANCGWNEGIGIPQPPPQTGNPHPPELDAFWRRDSRFLSASASAVSPGFFGLAFFLAAFCFLGFAPEAAFGGEFADCGHPFS